ncbi:RNA polymerase sigma factor [Granulicella sp. L60]|uniref:RNA polymerase sigma factor n=1 Tax=Granulicella sp. L60 TaxID=1641866 RepID=UPI00131CB7DA|nr:sigma-70 family RNA polymerase sigma factor [Granulicella sp. L60]
MVIDRGTAADELALKEVPVNYATERHIACDEVLVRQAKAGDMLAFESLVKQYNSRIFRTVYRITAHRQDAEDAMQDALFRAYYGLQQFQGNSSFCTWLTRIAINQALMCLRKRRSGGSMWLDPSIETEDGSVLLEIPEWRPDPEQETLKSEVTRMLHHAVGRLPQPSQRAFVMRYIEEFTTEEVAKELGISVAAVKSRVLRARRHLRERIGIRLDLSSDY